MTKACGNAAVHRALYLLMQALGGLWRALSWAPVLLFGCFLPACASPILPVEFWGCDAIKIGPVCLLEHDRSAQRTIRLRINGSVDDQSVLFETNEGSLGARKATGTDFYELTLPSKATWLRVRSQGLSGSSYLLRIELMQQPSWIRTSHELRYKDLPIAAEQTIREHLREELPTTVRAWAQGELGRALREQHKPKQALVEMMEAIRLDQQSGLLLDEARDVFLTAELLLDERRGTEVEKLLDVHAKNMDPFIENRPWQCHYRARALQLRGERQAALRALEQGEATAQLMQDLRSEPTLSVLRASILVELGRSDLADRLVAQAAARLSAFPCRKGLLLEMQASMRLTVLESAIGDGEIRDDRTLVSLWNRWEDTTSCGATAVTPAGRHDARLQCLLRQSQDVLEAGCAQPQYLAKVLLTQARLAVLMKRTVDADFALQAAERILEGNGGAEKVPALNLQWATLRARLALEQKHPVEAMALFDKLERLAQDGDDPYETRWRVIVGRAQVWLRTQREQQALDALRESQRILKQRARNTSPLIGRVSFMDRFEWSTRLLIDELYKAGGYQEALQTIRSTRIMALEELRVLSRSSMLTPAQQLEWKEAIEKYYETRRMLASQEEPVTESGEAFRFYRQQREAEKLQAAMHLLGEPLSGLSPRLPESGEMLLTCHPLRDEWLCLAAVQEGGQLNIMARKTGVLETSASPDELSRVLLQPFATLLTKSHTLTVLGFGALRGVALHMLPWGEGMLGDRLTVRYSLDIPGLRESAPFRCGRALAVVPQTLEAQAGLQLGAPIVEQLTHSGFVPQLEMQDRRYVRGNIRTLPLDLVLRQELPQVAFAHLLSHGEVARGNNWISHLVLSEFTTLTAGDVLALVNVPPQVALISCESGAAAGALSGQEALGLAQAFLLRGSQEVLATTRKVSLQAGLKMAQALYDNWRCGRSLAGALQFAVHSLANDPAIAVELDAFQVLVR